MPRPHNDIVDIDGLREQYAPADNPKGLKGRPWIAVQWECCSTYSRIYRNAEGTAYEGRCPKCQRPVRASIGVGGTNNRFFVAE